MVTAARRLRERVDGFELGADDDLSKPFEFDELVARIRALGRRQLTARPTRHEAAGVTLDPFRHEVTRDWRYVKLSRKEFTVLESLIREPDRFEEFAGEWGGRYPAIIQLWKSSWAEFAPSLEYEVEIRRVICTTNAIESINARYRRAVRARGHFPNEQAGAEVSLPRDPVA